MTLSRYLAAAACSRASPVVWSRSGKFATAVFCFSVATIRALAAAATAFYEVASTYEVARTYEVAQLKGLMRTHGVIVPRRSGCGRSRR